MASIDRTAYPRFKRSISVRELREAYSPSLDELEWARQMTGSDEALLSLTMCLKCCQRLGYFARFDEVPASITGHLRQELGLHESVNPAMVPDKTCATIVAWYGIAWAGYPIRRRPGRSPPRRSGRPPRPRTIRRT